MSIQYYHIDTETIRQIADGDEAAFKTLFVGYHKQVFRMAWKIFKSKEAAVQEVLLRLWSERQKLGTIEKLGAYINKIHYSKASTFLF